MSLLKRLTAIENPEPDRVEVVRKSPPYRYPPEQDDVRKIIEEEIDQLPDSYSSSSGRCMVGGEPIEQGQVLCQKHLHQTIERCRERIMAL